MPSISRPRTWSAATLVVGLGAGMLFVTSAVSSHGVDLRASSVTDLSSLLISERHRVNELQAKVAKANADVSALTQSTRDRRVNELGPSLRALRAAAGYAPIVGPGLTITLNDSPKRVIDQAQQSGDVPVDALLVHQQDIQAVVNALWLGGARGISVQGQRIVSITGIKCVGNTVVLQGVPYSPPYVIRAVGDVADLTAAINASEYVAAYKIVVDRYQLGWSLTKQSRLALPAYRGTSDLTSARVDTAALKAAQKR